jgi:hypothetical protein
VRLAALQDNPLGALGVQKLLKAVHEGEMSLSGMHGMAAVSVSFSSRISQVLVPMPCCLSVLSARLCKAVMLD